MAMGGRYAKNEDIHGFIRGAHRDGPDVCPCFEFHMPGSGSTPEKPIWGWNDIEALNCERCKRPDSEHIVLKEPEMPKLKPRPKMGGYADNRYDPDNMPAPSAQFHPTGTSAGAEPMATDPTSANPTPYYDTAARRAREAEADALFGASYVDDGMLDDMSDPLAINARPKPRPPPPRDPAPPPQFDEPAGGGLPPQAAALMAAISAPAAAEPVPTAPGDLADGVQDPALQELLARDASANEAFKREVERMVREANRAKEIDEREQQKAAGGAGGGGGGVATAAAVGQRVPEAKDLAGCAVPLGHFASVAELLKSVQLEQYEAAFEEEAMDPDTLIDVLQHQGKLAFDEALKDLGVRSMGHRMKITNALLIK